MDDRIAPMPPEPGRFGESIRNTGHRVADIVAAVVLWVGVCGLALLNGFGFLWYLAWSGTFSAPSCGGRPIDATKRAPPPIRNSYCWARWSFRWRP
ncbi:hypothetical protein [Nocardia sp. NPDC019395]|uniref:hypothetical protein n=1 Tax=Nocardia sp. NPDC019395 TaxID=3154686 RepID=UPI0033EE10CD